MRVEPQSRSLTVLMKPHDHPISYRVYRGDNIAILFRYEGEEQSCKCPFCGSNHIHGFTDGCRMVHCEGHNTRNRIVTAFDGTELHSDRGYFVKTILKTGINKQPKCRL